MEWGESLRLDRALALIGRESSLATNHTQPSEQSFELPVMTYNIRHGEGMDGQVNLQRIAEVIRRQGASIVCLQEVDRYYSQRSGFEDQAEILAAMLGMQHCYGANIDLDPAESGEPRRQYGLAILSRFPILEYANIPLPQLDPANEQRGLLKATIEVEGVRILVGNTHPQTDLRMQDNTEERAAQVLTILEQLRQHTEPVILMGDFNAHPAAPELAPLTELLVDGFAALGSNDFTYTFSTAGPVVRIDYIFVSPAFQIEQVMIPNDPLVASASDHFPVAATLRMALT